jgi:hypothetical protein
MASFRPVVNENDNYIQKIIKYIPAEIVAGYTALVGYLSFNTPEIPKYYVTYYLILLVSLAIITPVWTYVAVIDDESGPLNKKTRAIFHSSIATISFLIWVYAVGNPLLKELICSCADCPFDSKALGSIILVLFTILTPLLEKIFLGTKLPK